jgi:photosystem II stability/assembly factor-like uncharacterized protein
MGLRAVVLVWLAALLASPAQANGRLPGATELAINRSDRDHLIARATFGMVQSFDGGETWQWICERAVNVSGEADPPVAVTEDGAIVLLPPARGTLVSRDRGCTWQPAPAPFADSRAMDLTVDPNEPARVLIVLSSVDTIDDEGVVAYENVLMESRDNARTWAEVSRLPSSFFIETLEIASSDSSRIYVAGTSSMDPSLGIVQRSDDGGQTWIETSVELPPGSGSMFISAIDPNDPDRLWVRLPARGDRFGILPVALIMSRDKGERWEMLAATANQAMLGFALSPDGTQLAYGGPGDGLFLGPSDGSDGFTKLSDLRVRCLRWNDDGLYACGTESLGDPFSVGVSSDDGASFKPIYRIEDTCPQECPDSTSFELTCKDVWSALSPVLDLSGESCSVPWARPREPDAGTPNAGTPDAATPDAASPDAARDPSPQKSSSSGCSIVGPVGRTPHGLLAIACGMLLFTMKRRWHLGLWWAVIVVALGCSDSSEDARGPIDESDAAAFVACPDSIPELEPGVSFTGREGMIRVEVLDASPMPARKYKNEWTIALTDASGEPLDDVEITRLEAYMPVHEHFSRPPAEVERLEDAGQLGATIHFIMRGPWEVQLEASSPSAGDDYVVLDVCVEN